MYHSPEPHFSFTIPSIRDDTTLDCRIFHPRGFLNLHHNDRKSSTTWLKRGIVMAHPYAPLGGSYDDRVVGIVVEEFLSLGYIVGTFNFRGAAGSKGRTSWSGKPEVSDYISFAGLFMHYLSYVRPHPAPDMTSTAEQPCPTVSLDATVGATEEESEIPLLILGGYSHGSLILQHLPPVPSILQPFSAPTPGSAAHEILLRSRKLSDQINQEWISRASEQERQVRQANKNKLSVTMGGEETKPDQRRSSKEIRHTAEGRHSQDVGHALRNFSRKNKKHSTPDSAQPEDNRAEPTIQIPQVRYLLISPLTGPLSILAAPGLGLKLWQNTSETKDVIGKHDTLVLYGDQDVFSSAKKVTAWVQSLEAEPGSRVSHVEIAGAGHFWLEPGVEEKLRRSVREWEARV